jgi:mono/diheme cytochrome c family protein
MPRTPVLIVLAAAAAAILTAVAPARPSATIVGNAKAGKTTFTNTCGACHTLKAAKTVGTIGPNLDKVKPALAEATIIKAVTNGGATVMTKAAVAKYTTQMVAYKGVLSTKVIDNVAAFVYASTHATAK